jgi:phosphohistidine phosphatase
MMNKQLLILRHGKSSWEFDCDDFDRPLVERGKRGAELLGVWLQQQNLLPDFILSSPAVRAIETARKCCKAMGISDRHIYQEPRIYEANAATLKAILNECPHQAQRVMLVGHNPGLEHLLTDLVHTAIATPENGKLLPTATLAHLTLAEYWSRTSSSCAQLNSITCASSLGQGFPFITLTGTELRPRPAYYYAQSGVIPYHIVDGELKLLLISAGSKEKWAFPKGVIEPGLSPQLSAAKEAWEEAGLKGIVADQALGSYSREKWDGVCAIEVFPMAVTQMVDTHEWEESHRQRQWFSAKEAIAEINNPTLAKMIKQLLANLEQTGIFVKNK